MKSRPLLFALLMAGAALAPAATFAGALQTTALPDPVPIRIKAKGAVLAGEILMPAKVSEGSVPGVVIVHGSGRLDRQASREGAEELAAMGMAVLIYDKRGVGQSTGRYRDITPVNSPAMIGELADDANRALAALAAHRGVDKARLGLFGGSQAGWILPKAAADNPEVRFLVVLSGPAVSVGFMTHYGLLAGAAEKDVGEEELGKRRSPFIIIHGYDPLETLRGLRTPTLWILGERDRTVPLIETLRVLESLPAAESGLLTLVRLPDADHQLALPDGSRVDYWGTVESWLRDLGILSRGRRTS
ncbi:MAG: hypothetical protein FJY82_03195 [Candidatus Aminicenantes bacterium]|nr:hypothetical protein [Candidatus Aminicenantes bacterium]